mmetsp:Transcript_10558/g.31266  ORF Transcript_10558/g.31266 Transcript_10558/m.31266 type:complete len:228 (+) Transcript_10558:150-833(+)
MTHHWRVPPSARRMRSRCASSAAPLRPSGVSGALEMAIIMARRLSAPRALVREAHSFCVLASHVASRAISSRMSRSSRACAERPSFVTCRFRIGSETEARCAKARRASSSRWRLSRWGLRRPPCATWQKRQPSPSAHTPRAKWMHGCLQSPGCPMLPTLHAPAAAPRTTGASPLTTAASGKQCFARGSEGILASSPLDSWLHIESAEAFEKCLVSSDSAVVALVALG